MPRLSNALLRKAAVRSPFLPILLRECRDLEAAQNELRWLKDYAQSSVLASETSEYGKRLSSTRKPYTTLGSRRRFPADISIPNERSYVPLRLLPSSLLEPHQRFKKINTGEGTFQRALNTLLQQCVYRRSRGEPLQYIIGNQPFGDLEILCRNGVLIPRPETEIYTLKVGELLCRMFKQDIKLRSQNLKILDIGTGSGCIPLLLHSILRKPQDQDHEDASTTESVKPEILQILGIDISETALALARDNLHHNVKQGKLSPKSRTEISFAISDILDYRALTMQDHHTGDSMSDNMDFTCDQSSRKPSRLYNDSFEYLNQKWDVIISNPPYISPTDYGPNGRTSNSVRKFEPRLALVPPAYEDEYKVSTNVIDQADRFYYHILQLSNDVRAKLIVLEVGDSDQASRVLKIARLILKDDLADQRIEIWYDNGNVQEIQKQSRCSPTQVKDMPDGTTARAVVIWREQWAKWRQKLDQI